MRKNFYLMVAGCFAFNLALAQPSFQPKSLKGTSHQQYRSEALIPQFGQQQDPLTAKKNLRNAKTTAVKSRLVARVEIDHVKGHPSDSARITWSGSRGDEWNGIEDSNFDTYHLYYWNKTNQAYEDNYLIEQTIDSLDRVTSTVSRSWDQGNWNNSLKTELTYNANNEIVSFYESKWDIGAQNWFISYKEDNSFNANGAIDTATYLYWSTSTGSFDNGDRYILEYDNNGNIALKTSQRWDGSVWTSYGKETRTHDAAGNLTEYVYQEYDNGAWEYTYKETNTFDAAGNNTSWITYYWRNGAFEERSRAVQQFNSNNQRTQINYYDWDAANSQWLEVSQYTYTYDSRGNNTNSLEETFRYGTWENVYRYTHTYDANDNRLMSHSEKWVNNQWENIQIIEEAYNQFNQSTRIIWKIWDGQSYYDEDEYIYYYEEYETKDDEENPVVVKESNNNGGSLKIHPNPAQTQIQIQLNWDNAQEFTALIYDVQGRLYKKWTSQAVSNYEEVISLTGMSSGTYWIQIIGTRGGRFSQRISVY